MYCTVSVDIISKASGDKDLLYIPIGYGRRMQKRFDSCGNGRLCQLHLPQVSLGEQDFLTSGCLLFCSKPYSRFTLLFHIILQQLDRRREFGFLRGKNPSGIVGSPGRNQQRGDIEYPRSTYPPRLFPANGGAEKLSIFEVDA